MKLVHRSFVITCLAGLLTAPPGTARSEGEPDGPKRIFHDDFIENLAGAWTIHRRVGSRLEQNSMTAEWVLNHQFLQLHMKDTGDPPGYEALVLIGYSYDDQRYIIHWCDTYGGKYSSLGYGKRSGDSIQFEFPDPESPFYNTFTWDPAGRKWTFRMESGSKDGKRTLFGVDTLERHG